VRCTLLLVTFIFVSALTAQERPTSVVLFGSFTTSSKLFPHPQDPDEISRSYFLGLNDLFHGGVELRRIIPAWGVRFALSVEYLQKSETIDVPNASVSVPVRDGYWAVPVELTAYFTLPIGNDVVRTYMGGGGGVYFGSRRYEVPGASADPVGHTVYAGIHILSGVECSLSPAFSLITEVKFRDVQFESVNQFRQSSTTVRGTTVPLDQTPFASRINIDGMTLKCGAAFHF
jgi:hypothetical protein